MVRAKTKEDLLIDELLKDYSGPKQILGDTGLLKQLQKKLVEHALQAELNEHLGYEAHEEANGTNRRNGRGRKTVQSESGQFEIEVPRDRDGSFEPQIVKKRQRRLEGFDEKVLSLYGGGLSTREIQSQLEELYGVEVSPTLISNVTDAVLDEVKAWRSRPLDAVYPIVYFDALMVKSRQDGSVKNRAIYLGLGINMEGEKVLLGLWMSENEGAKFWLSVFNDLKNRGMEDCFIACIDGLKGLPEAIEAVYPDTQIQLCIVHKVRNALKYVPWKDRKALAADLRAIYAAPTLEAAEQALEDFGERWDDKYPAISPAWRADWQRLTVLFDYPPEIRRAIYTTNAIESLDYSMRKVLKNRGAFPTDESIFKVLYLGLNRVARKWTLPIRNWKAALNQFVIMFGDRVPM